MVPPGSIIFNPSFMNLTPVTKYEILETNYVKNSKKLIAEPILLIGEN
jgi:hypothetical protein